MTMPFKTWPSAFSRILIKNITIMLPGGESSLSDVILFHRRDVQRGLAIKGQVLIRHDHEAPTHPAT